jgi:hypothetical protein
MSPHISVTPMKASGIQHQVDRVYREGGAHQWVRETYINSIEANATKIEFGIEWQAVEEKGVYRRLIADNGRGMSPSELVGFFNVWGGGGKPIGGVHENFGIGAKSSLLPWNRHGLVVISWVDGEPAMIWVTTDPITGEYGLRNFEAETADGETQFVDVVVPFADAEHGCDWSQVKPDWIEEHGTVLILLGDSAATDTVLGDPNRADEADIKAISTYLNRRIWAIPDGVAITVDELRNANRATWPDDKEMAHSTGGADRRTNRRAIEGAKYYIEYPRQSFTKGKLGASGTVALTDGTEIDWYLWDGERPGVHSYAAIGGYIAALYNNELYDVTNHHSTYRSFGVLEQSVRSKLWMLLRPRAFNEDDGKHGVYPRGDRNSLLLMGGAHAGDPLPVNDWGAEFAAVMPEPIRDAINAARAGAAGTVTDQSWRDRLAERFGRRWRITKLRMKATGTLTVDASQPGSRPRVPGSLPKPQPGHHHPGGEGGTGGIVALGTNPGIAPAIATRVSGGIPAYIPVTGDEIEDEGMLATWMPNHPEHPEGAVLVKVDHPVLKAEIEHWQGQYPDHLADQIAGEVVAVYGEMIVAKVAHSEYMKSLMPSSKVENELRSDAALTMALLGLIGEEAVIAPRVGGKFGRARAA